MAGQLFPGFFNVAEPQAEFTQGQRDTTQYNEQQDQYNLQKQLQAKQLDEQKWDAAGYDKYMASHTNPTDQVYFSQNVPRGPGWQKAAIALNKKHGFDPTQDYKTPGGKDDGSFEIFTKLVTSHPDQAAAMAKRLDELGIDPHQTTIGKLLGAFGEQPGAMIPGTTGSPEVKGQPFLAPRAAIDNSIDMGAPTPAVVGQPAITAQAAVPAIPPHQGPGQPAIDFRPPSEVNTQAKITADANSPAPAPKTLNPEQLARTATAIASGYTKGLTDYQLRPAREALWKAQGNTGPMPAHFMSTYEQAQAAIKTAAARKAVSDSAASLRLANAQAKAGVKAAGGGDAVASHTAHKAKAVKFTAADRGFIGDQVEQGAVKGMPAHQLAQYTRAQLRNKGISAEEIEPETVRIMKQHYWTPKTKSRHHAHTNY